MNALLTATACALRTRLQQTRDDCQQLGTRAEALRRDAETLLKRATGLAEEAQAVMEAVDALQDVGERPQPAAHHLRRTTLVAAQEVADAADRLACELCRLQN